MTVRDERLLIVPADLADHEFPPAGALRRGFDKEAVRLYLSGVVAPQMSWLHRMHHDDQAEIQRLRKRIIGGQATPYLAEAASQTAARLIEDAQAEADQRISNAAEDCRQRVEYTRAHCAQMITQANQRAREIAEQAQAAAAAGPPGSLPSPEEWAAARERIAYLEAYGDALPALLRPVAEQLLANLDQLETKREAVRQQARGVASRSGATAQQTQPEEKAS